jgi:hypothetical protein
MVSIHVPLGVVCGRCWLCTSSHRLSAGQARQRVRIQDCQLLLHVADLARAPSAAGPLGDYAFDGTLLVKLSRSICISGEPSAAGSAAGFPTALPFTHFSCRLAFVAEANLS